MIGERVALLVGLFLVPAGLLWLGHAMRDRSPRERRAFWGGVIAYVLSMVVTLSAAMAPPVWWHGGNVWRDAAVHWTLLVGTLVGVAVGLARRRPPTS